MPLVQYWKLVVLERYAKFDGRSDRAEYWWFFLADFILFAVLGVLERVSVVFAILYFAVGLALLIPSLAVGVRRLHDTGRSGWWLLVALVPCVGFVVLLVFLVLPSDVGPNAYGPAPVPLPTT